MSGKPNVIVAQSGGPTTVINSSACGVIQEAMGCGKIGKVYGATNGILGVMREDLFDISAEKPETIEAMKRTPAAAIGSCRYKMKSLDDSRADFFPYGPAVFVGYIGLDRIDRATAMAVGVAYARQEQCSHRLCL